MTCYSVQPRDRIFVKRYGFSSFAKYIDKNISESISENLSSKCSQNFLINLNNLPQMHLKLLKKSK